MAGVLVWRRISIVPLKAKPGHWSWIQQHGSRYNTACVLHFKQGNYFSIMIMASLELISQKTQPHFYRDGNFLSGARIFSPLVPCFSSPITLLDSAYNARQSSPSPQNTTPPASPNIHPDKHTPRFNQFTHTYHSTPDAPHPAPLANHFKGRCYQTRGRPSEANPSRDPGSSDQTRQMDFLNRNTSQK